MKDRRHDNRLFCADLVEVRWQRAGHDLRRIANLEDISASGVCLLMECNLEIGTPVIVRCGQEDFSGSVRHSSESLAGFLVGIEFARDSRWSVENYRPEHLLDPLEVFGAEASRQTKR